MRAPVIALAVVLVGAGCADAVVTGADHATAGHGGGATGPGDDVQVREVAPVGPRGEGVPWPLAADELADARDAAGDEREAAGLVPPFGLTSGAAAIDVPPTTFCWSARPGVEACGDEFPRPEDHVIASGGELLVTFAAGDLTVGAGPTFTAGPEDPIVQPDTPLAAREVAPGTWRVDLTGLAGGEHALHLWWTGPEGSAGTVVTLRVG